MTFWLVGASLSQAQSFFPTWTDVFTQKRQGNQSQPKMDETMGILLEQELGGSPGMRRGRATESCAWDLK